MRRSLWPRKRVLTADEGRSWPRGLHGPHAQHFPGLVPVTPPAAAQGLDPSASARAALGLGPFHLEEQHPGQLCLSLSDRSVLGKLLC